MPTTCAPSSRRHAVARSCSARSGSSAVSTVPLCGACPGPTSTPHAPLSSACSANRPPSWLSPGSPTNRSPWVTSRESMTVRRGPWPEPPSRVSVAWAALATRSGDHACTQRLPRDGDVVEGLLAPLGELLALLGALAGDDHDVAGLGQADRLGDRAPAVALDANAGPLDARHDLGDDRLRVLG